MNEDGPMDHARDNHDWQLIASHSYTMGCPGIVGDLIRHYPQFTRWSGSHSPQLHHYGTGGLVRHTREVINLGLQAATYLDMGVKVDLCEYFLAALFHDTGKMFDYGKVLIDGKEQWAPTPHKRIIHHISRSVLIWHDHISKYPELEQKYDTAVTHAILAHHGQREWGSPVAPLTHVAWLLHLSDGISARMNDCDRNDYVLQKGKTL